MNFSKYNNKSGFTLIELVISITIMSIILVSVMDIFILSNDISYKADINRNMQKNIKNVVETIAEDLRKNGVSGGGGVSNDVLSLPLPIPTGKFFVNGSVLYTNTAKYYLGKKGPGGFVPVINFSDCLNLNEVCRIIISDLTGQQPLSNDSVTFTDLSFFVTNTDPVKVTISFKARPSAKKGVKVNLIKDNIINFQTTITERFIKNY